MPAATTTVKRAEACAPKTCKPEDLELPPFNKPSPIPKGKDWPALLADLQRATASASPNYRKLSPANWLDRIVCKT